MSRANGQIDEATASFLYGEILDINERNAIQGRLGNGNPYSDIRLKELACAEGYELTSITRDSDGVVTSAVVLWPDGTAGVFTTVTKNTTWLTIDAFTITYLGSITKTIAQAAVTRDSSGAVTAKPAMTIAP